MRPLSILLLALGIVGCASSRGSTRAASPEVEATLLRTEDAWYDALVHKDREKLETFLSDDFVLSGLNPSLETRSQYLQTVQLPERTLEPLVLEDRRVRVYGDAAVTTGRALLRGIWNERPLAISFRYTNVFVKRDDRWVAVASHVSKIEP